MIQSRYYIIIILLGLTILGTIEYHVINGFHKINVKYVEHISYFNHLQSSLVKSSIGPILNTNETYNTTISFVNEKSYITRYSDGLFIVVKLEYNNTPVTNAQINFYAKNETLITLLGVAKTNSSGFAILDIPNIYLHPGNYTLIAEFVGNETYNSAKAQAPLLILREITKIIAGFDFIQVNYSDSADFKIRLVTDENEPVVGRKVRVWILTQSGFFEVGENTSMQDGTITITINLKKYPFLDVGDYSIEIRFGGDDFYEPCMYKTQLRIMPDEMLIHTTFIGKKKVGSQLIILISITDAEGDPVGFAMIKVLINSSVIAVGDCDRNGVFKVEWIPYKGGIYVISISANHTNYVNTTVTYLIEIIEETQQTSGITYFSVIMLILAISILIAIVSKIHTKARK